MAKNKIYDLMYQKTLTFKFFLGSNVFKYKKYEMDNLISLIKNLKRKNGQKAVSELTEELEKSGALGKYQKSQPGRIKALRSGFKLIRRSWTNDQIRHILKQILDSQYTKKMFLKQLIFYSAMQTPPGIMLLKGILEWGLINPVLTVTQIISSIVKGESFDQFKEKMKKIIDDNEETTPRQKEMQKVNLDLTISMAQDLEKEINEGIGKAPCIKQCPENLYHETEYESAEANRLSPYGDCYGPGAKIVYTVNPNCNQNIQKPNKPSTPSTDIQNFFKEANLRKRN